MPEYLTLKGLEKLKKGLDYLKKVKRKEIVERLEKCTSSGEELSENSEYLETKEEQGFLEGRILELEELIKEAVILPYKKHNGWAQIGSTILITNGRRKEKFTIVGAEEANSLKGKISINSPLGKAIFNKPKGSVIKIDTPRGRIQYKILKII